VGDWKALYFIYFLNCDAEVAVVYGYLGGACHELDKSVHGLLVKGLHDGPQPPNDCRLCRVTLVGGLTD